MTAYVAPSPPWRSPWSRAYVVFLWVVTWTSGRASRSANTCGELNVASRHGLAALLRRERRFTRPDRRAPVGTSPVHAHIHQGAQLPVAVPPEHDHEIEAR